MSTIPKIIHQTWKDHQVPEQWVGYQQKVRELHPDWEYRLWTDKDNDEFIKSNYPALWPIYQTYPKPVMKADVIRYAIMDQIGGLYLDLDYEMLKPFDYKEGLILPKSRDRDTGDSDDRIGNCIMASSAGHPFWKVVLDKLTHEPMEIGLEEFDVEKATGPLLLTGIFFSGEWTDFTTPQRPLFHPPSPRNPKQYQAILEEGTAYGIHHAHGSWRRPQWQKFLFKLFGKKI